MSEGIPAPSEKEPTKKEKIIALALELHERNDIFPFTAIDPESYSKMKATEEEYPGYVTPVDELIERFKNEGMNVVPGGAPQSGNVYILPAESSDIERDGISPTQLQLSEGMDEKLRELVTLVRS